MTKKILFCASTLIHIKNFHLPYLKAFKEKGYEVWVAANKSESIPYADYVVAFPFCKSFTSIENIKTIFALRKLLKQQDFTIISTHTTLASALVRAAVMLIYKKPKVFNTSHGYLFHETDGLKKWAYLLPEKICARVTDVLMVMNHEDYDIAKKHKLYKDKLYYINGMGIDLSRFKPVSQEERSRLRKEHGFSDNDFLFVYAAEFSKRKNHNLLIRAFANVSKDMANSKLLLAGDGVLLCDYRELVNELHLNNQICFLGYVEDIKNLYAVSDACVTTSRIEGLPFNVMEAMASGLPVIASNIKGHRELTDDGKAGLLFENRSEEELEEKLKLLNSNKALQEELRYKGQERVKKYGLHRVFGEIIHIYRENMII